ncbi:hypothetical protein NBRC116601_22790 [Cognatishimia sp. WU-CL00825]|uniref:hypothetical protein n=1 Tax=Cognatishimia sp. WU-CL00825 TaxID=3127658 RepID=UPI0031072FEC
MNDYTLTKTRLFEGIWEGVVSASDLELPMPTIQATHLEQVLEKVVLSEMDKGQWGLRIPIPASTLADGVQTILIRDAIADETLEVITLISGEALAGDIRSEMDLLRAELDMLKRAFRRHCLETM